MEKNIAVLSGDGIGPEVINQSLRVLDAIGTKYDHKFIYHNCLIGGISIEKTGIPISKSTLDTCLECDSILFGAIGNPKYDNSKIIPEQGLLKLRKKMGVYCNIRPIKGYKKLLKISPIKKKYIENVDFLIYRELTNGIYFGKKGLSINKTKAYDVCNYEKKTISRIATAAFKAALKRKKKVTLVDKANVLETSRLWRETLKEIHLNFKEVQLDYLFIDNASMQIIFNPKKFDILLTDNMFGDILSDEASAITGSLGLIPSSSIGKKTPMYEPIHGSYPQAAGKNIANPLGSILSVAMMLEDFGMKKESFFIKNAVNNSLKNGVYTKDLNPKSSFSTKEVGDFLINYIINENK
ncbi:3-isopropylmalate dehydrogenase [Candidatus Karelsulcia muelleri]|uniref:3-isopropylmalate dehydrogenase n=1 Tax=Candidatus Karelsulcia muelleri TaxID=336810 RepID=UPI000D7C3E46|nr:3-isopropylmalate dehydrogenase [Candidatus Karelsulcia muelleri]